MNLIFKPESSEFNSATEEYKKIWDEEGEKILDSFERVTSLRFQEEEIEVIVYEGPSFSGKFFTPMKLRASYSYDVKKGTLIHELGHRLIAPLHKRIEGIDEHRTLNLFLYDVWVDLYGKEFANSLVAVEGARKGLYDYAGAWGWFMALDEGMKDSKWKDLLSLNL